MRYSIVSAAVLTLMAGASNAQMTLETGSIDLAYLGYETAPGLSTYMLSARGAYSIGQMGMQLDGAAAFLTDGSTSVEEYSVGGHVYKPLGNGSKIGAFGSASRFAGIGSGISFYSVGAEGMASFGALDVETSLGYSFTDTSGNTFWTADVGAYFDISPAIEVNAGYMGIFNSSTSYSIYRVGADYTLPNIPLSIGATYYSSEGTGIYEVNASFAFGPSSQERLFGVRMYPLYIGP